MDQPFSFTCKKNFLWSVTKERSCISLLGFQNVNKSTKEVSKTVLSTAKSHQHLQNQRVGTTISDFSYFLHLTTNISFIWIFLPYIFVQLQPFFFSFLSLSYSPLYECIKCIHSAGHLGHFQLRTIMNSVAMNTLIIAH